MNLNETVKLRKFVKLSHKISLRLERENACLFFLVEKLANLIAKQAKYIALFVFFF